MAVTTTLTNETISTKNLQKLFYNQELIKQLARELVANQVDAHIQMAADCDPGDYSTYADAESCIKGALVSVEDYMADLLTDFRDTLYEEVRKVEIVVKTIQLSKDGLEDADVEVR